MTILKSYDVNFPVAGLVLTAAGHCVQLKAARYVCQRCKTVVGE